MDVLCENFDTFEKYNVDQYMSTMGLSVAREYRGRSIGSHFFNTRSVKFAWLHTNQTFFCHNQYRLQLMRFNLVDLNCAENLV